MLSHMKLSRFSVRRVHLLAVKFKEFVEDVDYEKGKVKVNEKPEKPEKNAFLTGQLFQFEKWDTSIRGLKSFASSIIDNRYRKDQIICQKRLDALGADLAAAHFFVRRGGIVKFVGINQIFEEKNYGDLPGAKDSSFKVEALNLRKFNLYYEGLDHLENLECLRSLSVCGIERFDNWYLDRLSNLVPHLEYLDISNCKNIDHNGLHCIYRFKNLKCLNVEGISDSSLFRLTALTLEFDRPGLVVLGHFTKPKAKSAFDEV